MVSENKSHRNTKDYGQEGGNHFGIYGNIIIFVGRIVTTHTASSVLPVSVFNPRNVKPLPIFLLLSESSQFRSRD